jgi:nitrogen fixation protein NifU and related proteins
MPGLEDLYREIILDHYRNPRNRGELPAPPSTRVEGFNPLCGDEIILYLDVDGEAVRDVKISGQGCSISQSSASMMSSAIKGLSVADVRRLAQAFKAMMSIHEQALDDDGSHPDGGATAAVGSNGVDDPAVTEVKLGDLEALRGVVKFPVRIKCATLSWNTLLQALDES